MTVSNVAHAPTIITLPIDIYDELREKARKYDEIIAIRSCKDSPHKDEIFCATLNVVCIWFNQTPEKVLSKSRSIELMETRKAIVYCLTRYRFKLQEIATFLNRKNHTTIMNTRDTVLGIMGYDKDYSNQMKNILHQVNTSINDLQKHI